MPEGCIAVVDAMGVTDAGIFGDILCARMAKRGVAALITDGVVRDVAGVLATNLPVWCQGVAAPPSVAGLTFVDWQQPIGCGGIAVFPDDIIMADDDGAVLIPAALVDEVVELAPGQERLERWIMREVQAGSRCRASIRPTPRTKRATKRRRAIEAIAPRRSDHRFRQSADVNVHAGSTIAREPPGLA
ncbi:hypothetical protein MesoLjLb_71580 [Mesorhizobium sp. L-8-3]|nr:hypothetical protein MesoLjLb_71580 [Mesorhizobium sp. L-8-3]